MLHAQGLDDYTSATSAPTAASSGNTTAPKSLGVYTQVVWTNVRMTLTLLKLG